MRKSGGGTDVSPCSSALIAFKPRQVLLAEQQRRNRAEALTMAKNHPGSSAQLKPEQETILTYSVALWLENKGFSKVLKRFLVAAQIQDDDWKASALNMNEIFSKYQEFCNGVQKDLKPQTKQEEQVGGSSQQNGDTNAAESEDIGNKKKKKKRSNGEIAVTDDGKTSEEKGTNGTINKSNDNGKEENQKSRASKESNDEKFCEVTVDQSSKMQKDKKKKKGKSTSESLGADEKVAGVMPEVSVERENGLPSKSSISKNDSEVVDELKDKKKKKKQKRDGDLGNKAVTDKDTSGVESEDKKVEVEVKEDEANETKKASKKRKRMATDENENQPGREVAVEESKPKKSKGLDEGKDVAPQNKENTLSATENGKDNSLSNGLGKVSQSKSAGKKHNSSEPKTVNAFQRVKIDEVEFVDERLQDNSYWAKDGAEIGYGAKAQEILGQVKGRDFRHEKTKKKRGSYRGGQIDLQSHSIKFNYSDED